MSRNSDEMMSNSNEIMSISDGMLSNSDEMTSNSNAMSSNRDAMSSNRDAMSSTNDEMTITSDETNRNSDKMKNNSDGKKSKAEFTPVVSASKFHKKVRTMMKDIYELSTLSGVPACLVIRTPEIDAYKNLPRIYTWPESIDEFRRVVEFYKSRAKWSKDIGSSGDQILKQRVSLSKDVTAAEGERTENPELLSELGAKIEAVDGKIGETEIGGSGFVGHNVLMESDEKTEAAT